MEPGHDDPDRITHLIGCHGRTFERCPMHRVANNGPRCIGGIPGRCGRHHERVDVPGRGSAITPNGSRYRHGLQSAPQGLAAEPF